VLSSLLHRFWRLIKSGELGAGVRRPFGADKITRELVDTTPMNGFASNFPSVHVKFSHLGESGRRQTVPFKITRMGAAGGIVSPDGPFHSNGLGLVTVAGHAARIEIHQAGSTRQTAIVARLLRVSRQ